jgi:hypothetical protein
MYPEARHGIDMPTSLRVLTLDTEFIKLPLQYIAVLQNYLSDMQKSDVRVELLTVIDTQITQAMQEVEVVAIDLTSAQSIIDTALSENIDVIHDPAQVLSNKDRFKLKDSFVFTSTPEELAKQIESYLAGHAIPWQFYEPIWHNAWLLKYVRSGGIAQVASDFIATAQLKNYSPKQLAYVRSLTNKALYIEYSREQLYYYLQLKRYAFRQNNHENDFSFELVYHLSNYTVFICGAMDILARLLNDLYDLGYGRFQSYSIEKQHFIDKLSPKRKTLADIFALKKYQDWIDWMKTRRNNLAHESHLYLTPLIQSKKNPLTDAELEQKVDDALDWNLFESSGLDLSGLRAMIKQNLDLQLNYEEIVGDMMMLERIDRTTKDKKNLMVFPLRTIDEDHAKISEIVKRSLDNLGRAKKQKAKPVNK